MRGHEDQRYVPSPEEDHSAVKRLLSGAPASAQVETHTREKGKQNLRRLSTEVEQAVDTVLPPRRRARG